MTQSLWEPEALEQQAAEQQPAESEQNAEASPQAEAAPLEDQPGEQFEPQAQASGQAEPAAVALSADEFTALEERILRAVQLVKRERASRSAAEERATQAEALLSAQSGATEGLQKEVDGLKAERDHVRQRVERLLGELDALEL